MIILRAIENVVCFLALCATACSVGMFFSLLILYAKRKSVHYEKWEDLIARSFWKIMIFGLVIALCVSVFILK
mgnify:CR=1 FL=1